MNKRVIIKEDTTAIGNKWSMGNTQHNMHPQKMSLADLYANTSSVDSLNTVQVKNTLPFPYEHTHELFGDIYMRIDQLKNIIKTSKDNPKLKGKEHVIDSCIVQMITIKRLIKDIVSKIDKKVLNSSKDELSS